MGTDITPQAQPSKADQFHGWLANTAKKAIQSLLPKHLDASRVLRLVYQEAVKPDSKLLDCAPVSILSCLVDASKLGLEVGGPLAGAYLIPRKGVCTLLISYRGLIELGQRSAMISDISAGVIYSTQIKAGLVEAEEEPPMLRIKADLINPVPRDPTDIVAAYCVVRTKDGGRYQKILNIHEILDRRDRGGYGKSQRQSPWDTDFAAMARKSAIRALFQSGVVPMSAEFRDVLESDEAVETSAAPIATAKEEMTKQLAETPQTVEPTKEPERVPVASPKSKMPLDERPEPPDTDSPY